MANKKKDEKAAELLADFLKTLHIEEDLSLNQSVEGALTLGYADRKVKIKALGINNAPMMTCYGVQPDDEVGYDQMLAQVLVNMVECGFYTPPKIVCIGGECFSKPDFIDALEVYIEDRGNHVPTIDTPSVALEYAHHERMIAARILWDLKEPRVFPSMLPPNQ